MASLVLFVAVCVLLYYFILNQKYNYWNKIGVKGPTPIPIVGNFGKTMIMLQSISELTRKAYVKYPKERVVGLYCGFRKVILLRDPDIVKHVISKDFKFFMSRGLKTSEKGFSNNLVSSEGVVWKTLRKKLAPAFTSLKLKQMTPLVKECVDKLITETVNRMDNENPCDIKDLCEKYSLDIICSCVFGLNLDVYSKEIRHFRDVSKLATQPSMFFWFWYVAEMILPGIQRKVTKINPGSYLRSFFKKLVTQVISERENRGIKRNDLINILIELKAQDKSKADGVSQSEFFMDDNIIASQAFAFYVAGKDTSSSAFSFLLYELSLHPDIQDTVYQEICKVFNKFGDDNYDSIKEMKYLYMVFRETMRKHPSIGFLIRKAASNYSIPGTAINIDANTLVLISLSGMHNDPKYFKDPESFNPENFSEENSRLIPQYTYMPFGDGPRNCIGFRLAEMHILMAAATFLRKFKLISCTKPLKYNNCYTITLAPIGGIWVHINKR